MSDTGEKTEEATPQKLRKSREKGEVWQSKDLTAAAVLAVAAGVLVYTLPPAAEGVARLTAQLMALPGDLSRGRFGQDPGPLLQASLGDTAIRAMQLVAAPLVATMIVGVLVPFLQVGPLLSMEVFKFKPQKFNPVSGLKNIFLKPRTYVELAKNLLKLAFVVGALWLVLGNAGPELMGLIEQPPAQVLVTVGKLAGQIAATVIASLLALSVPDIIYQRWQFLKDQRMTKDEVKREYKESEGDPEMKGRRKQVHEEAMQESMVAGAAEADVMVTNPTHLACALRYRPGDAAPILIAKGKNAVARRLRRVAKEADVPIVRDRPLARAIFSGVDLGYPVPEELFDAVAEVMRWAAAVAAAEGREVAYAAMIHPAHPAPAAGDRPDDAPAPPAVTVADLEHLR